MDYEETLTRHYANRSLAVRAALILVLTFTMLPRVVWALAPIPGRSRAILDPFHAFHIGLTSLGLVIYSLSLLAALIALVVQVLPDSSALFDQLTNWLPTYVSEVYRVLVWVFGVFGGLFAIAAAFGLVKPGLGKKLTATAVEYHCMAKYLSKQTPREALSRQLFGLLDALAAKGPTYRRKHLVCFSFGSILALDCLFPYDRASATSATHFDSLVTIGCPIDMIHSIWPRYFGERSRSNMTAGRWINLFLRRDALGSDVAEGVSVAGANLDPRPHGDSRVTPLLPENICTEPQPLTKGGGLRRVVGPGVLSHFMYWDPEVPEPGPCFKRIVAEIRPGEPIRE